MRNVQQTILQRPEGFALLAAVVVLSLLAAVGVAYNAGVLNLLKLQVAEHKERAGFYAAEAGLNVGIARIANLFASGQVPDQDDFLQTLSIDNRQVDVFIAPSSDCNPCPAQRIPFGQEFGGLNSIPYLYTVRSRAKNISNQVEADVGGEFIVYSIPVFQFLAFIDGNLFIMPITNTTLHGRLHTNSRLYLDQSSTSVLAVQDSAAVPHVEVTSVDRIYRGGRKYSSTWQCAGTVQIDAYIDANSDGSYDPVTMPCVGADIHQDVTPWNGSVRDLENRITVPDLGDFQRPTGNYWKAADLRIVLNISAGLQAIDFSAPDLCPGAPNLHTAAHPAGPPQLYPIQVQDALGNVDTAKTRALWRFLCERRGAIFYTELPSGTGVTTPPADNWQAFDGAGPSTNPTTSEYSPVFLNSVNRVFRIAGEDTNGDGVVNSSDSNPDICPPSGTTYDWWRPSYCPS